MQMIRFIPERQSHLGFPLTGSHTDSSLITNLYNPTKPPKWVSYEVGAEKSLSLTEKEDLVSYEVIIRLTIVGNGVAT